MEAPAKLREVIRFGEFELRLSSAELTKFGLKIRLQEQPFQILVMLLGRPGEVVTREELRAKLWPGDKTFVDFEVGLNSAVLRLRNALGDTAESPRFVETVPRRGYRFIGLIEEAEPISDWRARGSEAAVEQSPQTPSVEESFREHGPATPTHPVQRKLWIAAGAAAALLVIVLSLTLRTRWKGVTSSSAPQRIQSIAVLPLENLTGDPTQDYFAEGVTEALTTDLAKISALRVISRTSAMQYKGTKKTLPQIAKELAVDAVIEGSVQRSGDRVRITAQLLDAPNDKHLWAESFERDERDVLVLDDEVARAIAQEIKAKLTPQEQTELADARPVDPQTYELYVRGRYFWNMRGEAAVQKSIDYFQQAIQKRPDYALAYAALAEAYIVNRSLSTEEKFSRAKAAARTALQMDDNLAEAHNALAMSLFCYDWDWAGAEKEFQRALALNPNYAQAHQWYGQYQHAMGRKNWADEVKRAAELDPLSPLMAGYGWAMASGQYDLAIQIVRKKLELYPNYADGYIFLGEVYARKGMYQDAIAQLQTSVSLSNGSPESLSALGYTYGVSGKRKDAVKILQQLTLLSKRRYVDPYNVALIYIGLGEKDLAFAWLKKAVAERSMRLVGLIGAQERGEMDNIRSDPRYAELKRAIGLPSDSPSS